MRDLQAESSPKCQPEGVLDVISDASGREFLAPGYGVSFKTFVNVNMNPGAVIDPSSVMLSSSI